MVEQALKRLLFDPKLATLVTNGRLIADLEDDHAALLAELLELITNRPDITTGALMEHYRDTEHAAILEQQLETPLELDQDAHSIEFKQTIDALLRKAEPSAFERARLEMQRRAVDPE